MTRRTLLGGLGAATMSQAQPVVSGERPNIILIMTDDQGWFDLGIHGNTFLGTPNIDKLAREGVRFSHFYCSPVCTPTRASLMTGRHYQRTGAVDTFKGRDTLDASEVTIADLLRQRGYRTACIGKWHLGRYMKYHPNHRGFDEYFGFWQYGFMNRYDDSDELFDNKTRVTVHGYITEVLTNRAISFIERNRSNQFFLYVPHNAPHSPYLVPDRYIERYLKKGLPLTEARIYGMNTCLDDNIGRLLEAVDNNGVRDRTIVIFMTDNGGVSNHFKAGLRGNKASVFEGGVRAPFIARWPRRFAAGSVVNAMAQHIDVFPTLCELTGTELPSDRTIDGKSLAPLLRTGKGSSPHAYIYHQWNRGRPVLTTVPRDPELKANWAIRNVRGFKLHASGELYDLEADAGETRNIADANPETARELRAEFARFFKDTVRPEYSRVPIEVGRPDENPVEIDLTWGVPSGKVVPQYRSYNSDTIDNWTDAGDHVRWKIDVVEPGDYEVVLSYGCAPGDEGSRARAGVVNGPSAEFSIRPRPGRMMWETETVGLLPLSRGPAVFEIRPVTIKAKELAAIHKIWLRRTNASHN
jgi:arylsulfatase A